MKLERIGINFLPVFCVRRFIGRKEICGGSDEEEISYIVS